MADQVLVFISHTSAMAKSPAGTSFVDGADAAINAIDQAKAYHMAYFPAADMTPANYSISKLSEADLFVAIVGFDFGSRVRGDPRRSYTELEFDAATELGLPRLVFLLKPEAAHLQGLSTRVALPAQMEFRTKLEESGATVAYFDSVADLKYQVQAAVNQWMEDHLDAERPEVVVTQGNGDRSGRSEARPKPLWPLLGSVALMALLVGGAMWFWKTAGPTTPQIRQPLEGLVARSESPTEPPECKASSITVDGQTRPTFVDRPGVVLKVLIRNDTSHVITVPTGRDVVATGRSGMQYDVTPYADSPWFSDVEIEPHRMRSFNLLLTGTTGSDSVTLVVRGVHPKDVPQDTCRLTSTPKKVFFAQ